MLAVYEVLNSMVTRINSALRQDNSGEADSSSTNKAGYRGGYNNTNVMSGLSLNDLIPSNGSGNRSYPTGTGQAGSSHETTPSSGLGFQFDLDLMSMPMDSLGAMIDMPASLDWDVFDNHVRPQQLSEETWPELSLDDFGFGNNYDYNL
ncbi:uncharacterized protein PAC_18137 [Phialocephala subalpina]|uniref:Uncharacterized protein n=1 Tax=Phialocephala subalpina TaxID=576137 RepID=A0A1L7XTC9_9HELO|nr:uncharacterized protein PAC_18137 [Phialocephala subalpina]